MTAELFIQAAYLAASVLFILGLDKRLADLADVRADDIGLGLEEVRLPQKIYLPRRQRETKP